MRKILFILFQGGGNNLKHWNEYTKSRFLDRLKTLGLVYTYQDKVYNLWHYNKLEKTHKDYSSDIDFDLSYVNPKTHIKYVYANIKKKYKEIDDYQLVPVGWSVGALFALYFAQEYKSRCIAAVLLDPVLWTKSHMTTRLETFLKKTTNHLKDILFHRHSVLSKNTDIPKLTNAKLAQLLTKYKTERNINDMFLIADWCQYYRSNFFSKHLDIHLSVPTISFVNIKEPELANARNKYFNNKNKKEEIATLLNANPETYQPVILKNKTHYVFNGIAAAKCIIKDISDFVANRI